jgi:DNA-binding PadR family transcriptional regulator
MTGSVYAAGGPWLRFAQQCSFPDEVKREVGDWIAAMTGRRGHRGQQPFGGHWGMFGGPPFGAPWAAGGPRGGWRGPKARRGDVRAAILAVLAEQPMNGYQLIQEIAERSGGMWKPSPGSIYPTLQQLEDEGLVTADAESGRRTFTLTDEGTAYVADHAEEVSAPWEAMTAPADDDESGLKPLIGQVAAAMWQILAVGNSDQQARARAGLIDLRRTLYAILAEDDAGDERS